MIDIHTCKWTERFKETAALIRKMCINMKVIKSDEIKILIETYDDTVCPRSLVYLYAATRYLKTDNTSWTYNTISSEAYCL